MTFEINVSLLVCGYPLSVVPKIVFLCFCLVLACMWCCSSLLVAMQIRCAYAVWAECAKP